MLTCVGLYSVNVNCNRCFVFSIIKDKVHKNILWALFFLYSTASFLTQL